MTADWCAISESRLLKQLLTFKPAGITRHFQMVRLTERMNGVEEDEESDLDELLSAEDLARVAERKAAQVVKEEPSDAAAAPVQPLTLAPSYALRPTAEQIWQKLAELYEMQTIEEFEYTPDEFEKHSEFFLPDGDFSQLIRAKEEGEAGGRGSARRRRRESGETPSSRCSTPQAPPTKDLQSRRLL